MTTKLSTAAQIAKDSLGARFPAGFQHRHFAAIAGWIVEYTLNDSAPDNRHNLANFFADKLASTNPNFDRARFLRACGVS